jgi:hypothetical protein
MTDSEKAEYEDMVRLLTTKCEELAAENTRLRSEKSDAMSVVKEIYNDPNASPALRLKAAGLALPHEVPRLTPVPPPLELTAERPPLPLAEKVRLQRMRADALRSPQHPGGILPPDHPDVAKWTWPEDESKWAEHAARLTGQDISGGNGDNSNSGDDTAS